MAPGATISLLVPVVIPPGRAHVGLPVKSDDAPSGYKTRCLLEVENVGEGPQEVPPGEYRVEKTTTEQTYFVDKRQEPVMLASNRLLLASEGASPRYRLTNVFLEPNQAAGIYRLGCSRLGGRNTVYVTIADMEVLLAGVVEFNDPGAAP